jgi:hypothetical protein
MAADEPLIATLSSGPGAGKSTTAAALFSRFKQNGVNCEFVHEVAKDFTWENRQFALGHQAYLIAKQLRNYDRLYGQVDLIITDTSPLLAGIYAPRDMRGREEFLAWVEQDWAERKTIDFFLNRDPHVRPYNEAGRRQTFAEAQALDDRIKALPTTLRYVQVDMLHMSHVDTLEERILSCLPH